MKLFIPGHFGVILTLSLIFTVSTTLNGQTIAFEGAEGGGRYTTGGRGGSVIFVTSLEDSNKEGTLRWALSQQYPRTILFKTGGLINLKKTIRITSGNVTIAGQSAPGDGICIAGSGIVVDADNVIIRYIRFRMGDKMSVKDADALSGRYHRNIIVDHCSMSWSTDECCSFYGNESFTLQWCIIAESLNTSFHSKGTHGYGGIWGGKNASFHHNLLAHHNSRNPRLDHPLIYLPNVRLEDFRGSVDIRNNVIYNWGKNNTYGGEGGCFNMIGNYYKPGPASAPSSAKRFITTYGRTKDLKRISGSEWYDSPYPDLYLSGNVMEGNESITKDNYAGVKQANTGGISGHFLESPFPINGLTDGHTTTTSAYVAFEDVLLNAGCNIQRDVIDKRIVYDARNGVATVMTGSRGSTNGLIDSQEDVGGWPAYKSGRPLRDSDNDGIPDKYEKKMGLDHLNPRDALMVNENNGRTMLENYLDLLIRK